MIKSHTKAANVRRARDVHSCELVFRSSGPWRLAAAFVSLVSCLNPLMAALRAGVVYDGAQDEAARDVDAQILDSLRQIGLCQNLVLSFGSDERGGVEFISIHVDC